MIPRTLKTKLSNWKKLTNKKAPKSRPLIKIKCFFNNNLLPPNKFKKRKSKRALYLTNHKTNLLTISHASTSTTTLMISSKKTSNSKKTINIPLFILSKYIRRRQKLKTWSKFKLLLRSALSLRECPTDCLSLNILILKIDGYHSKD
jgi:hypothetical protein